MAEETDFLTGFISIGITGLKIAGVWIADSAPIDLYLEDPSGQGCWVPCTIYHNEEKDLYDAITTQEVRNTYPWLQPYYKLRDKQRARVSYEYTPYPPPKTQE